MIFPQYIYTRYLHGSYAMQKIAWFFSITSFACFKRKFLSPEPSSKRPKCRLLFQFRKKIKKLQIIMSKPNQNIWPKESMNEVVHIIKNCIIEAAKLFTKCSKAPCLPPNVTSILEYCTYLHRILKEATRMIEDNLVPRQELQDLRVSYREALKLNNQLETNGEKAKQHVDKLEHELKQAQQKCRLLQMQKNKQSTEKYKVDLKLQQVKRESEASINSFIQYSKSLSEVRPAENSLPTIGKTHSKQKIAMLLLMGGQGRRSQKSISRF